ncbi:hypothetical protein HMPREF1548_01878 [Clostridium sp. KLE 1755]|nr:hypothetical protein HMPREF1548_01878 [Clostridium sp. KLE 1755]
MLLQNTPAGKINTFCSIWVPCRRDIGISSCKRIKNGRRQITVLQRNK